jgi:hypothetical protein
MAWQLDQGGIAYLMTARSRHRLGLPAGLPDDPDRPVTAAMLANRDIALDVLDHPLVLTFFSLHDPVPSIALAAAGRLMPAAAASSIGRQTAGWIAEAARHDRVRDGVADVVLQGFSPTALVALDWLARRTIDDDAKDGRQQMIALLKSLTRPGRAPADLVARLLALAVRIGMRRDTLDHLVLSLIEGRHVTAEAKTALIEGLDALPKSLRYRVMARVCALPDDMRTGPMKHALAAHLAEPERALAEAS